MGYIANINSEIEQFLENISDLKNELAITTDENEREIILETIADFTNSVGELKGALIECAQIDGCDDVYEYFNYKEAL